MVQIKEKLAILRVKKIWRRQRLTVRKVRERIRREKTKKIAMESKENYVKYLALNETKPQNTGE